MPVPSSPPSLWCSPKAIQKLFSFCLQPLELAGGNVPAESSLVFRNYQRPSDSRIQITLEHTNTSFKSVKKKNRISWTLLKPKAPLFPPLPSSLLPLSATIVLPWWFLAAVPCPKPSLPSRAG